MTREMELLLCAHGAPTLAGLKSGNLFRMPGDAKTTKEAVRHWNELLNGRGVYIRRMRNDEGCALIYIYRKEKLKKDWEKPGAAEFLGAYGYGTDVESNLARLQRRLGEQKEFPHEIGMFLSYPLEDVQGFIRNCGRNCRLCGAWKVYGDVESAKKCFACYRKCSEVYVKCYHKGHPLTRLTVAA